MAKTPFNAVKHISLMANAHWFGKIFQPMRYPEEIISRGGKTTPDEPDYYLRCAGI